MNEYAQLTLIDGTLVKGPVVSAFDIRDRGLAYGDGLFETMRVVFNNNKAIIPLLEWHIRRFEAGVLRLKLGDGQDLIKRFKQEVSQLLSALNNCISVSPSKTLVCKIVVTRGLGGAGYLPPELPDCQFISQIIRRPNYPLEYSKGGISVRVCQHRLAIQPALAGIKHLNRLDQVLASQELQGEQEGLLFDQNNYLIEGIKSNVLLFEGEKVYTPRLDTCGVQGTLRQYLLAQSDTLGIKIEEAMIDQNRFQQVDGVAMINSVFGIWPVMSIADKSFQVHPNCVTMQKYLQQYLGY